jgi:NADPH2:quinone reductase
MEGIICKDGKISVSKLSDPSLLPNQVLIKQHLFGINFDDIHVARGRLVNPNSDGILGVEAVGIIEEVGRDCKRGFKKGQRVCYCTWHPGAFTTYRAVDEQYLVYLTDDVPDLVAASLMKGLTAHMLLFTTYRLSKNSSIIITQATGGVGSILCQWAASIGVSKIIGIVGDDSKKSQALQNGCHVVFNWRKDNLVQGVKDVTDGMMVNAIYDGLGLCLYPSIFDLISFLGMWVSYGVASGDIPDFNLSVLRKKGLFITRPVTNIYMFNPIVLATSAVEFFKNVNQNVIRLNHVKYSFSRCLEAFLEIENGSTNGQKLLVL